MKFKQTKIAFLLIFLLAIPSGVLASFQVSKQTVQPLSVNTVYKSLNNQVAPAVSTSVKVIKIVQNSLITNEQPDVDGSTYACLPENHNSGSLVQNSGILNLNQPAKCFSLGIKNGSYSFAQLSVQPLAAVQKIVVVVSNHVITGPKLLALPGFQDLSVLPTAAVNALFQSSRTENKVKKDKLLLVIKKIKNVFSLQQLQVLRC